jgi:hypothetical protein
MAEEINVAASIIADISAGIYRSPAGALKELISNAFDADAPSVRISTGWPKFNTFTCTDNGHGMTPDEFRRIMSYIGGSGKRDAGEYSPHFRRPLIGRIGIGLLAIAQICRQFTVISSAEGERKKFQARIDLDPYLLAEARRKQLGQPIATEQGKVRIGQYEMEEAPEQPSKHYTRIVMERIDVGFQQRLTDRPQTQAGFSVRRFTQGRIEDFLRTAEKGTVAEYGAYAQMIWELAITTPIEYMHDGPIRVTREIDALRRRLEGYNFKAYVDGVQLKKPILLPQKSRGAIEHKVFPFNFRKSLRNSRKISVTGYLYWQKGRILPRELQGILVRVRNVAIGVYDPTYLGYPHHEGFKFSQITGELYVDKGLEPAINIDRSSFRESDEGFLELQSFLFEKLRGGADEGAGIFSKIKKETSKIRGREHARKARKRQKVFSDLTGNRAKLKLAKPVDPTEAPSGVALVKGSLAVQHDLLDIVPPKHQDLFIGICGIIETELARSVDKNKRKKIYEKLARLLQEF